jgi:hypothetical protein
MATEPDPPEDLLEPLLTIAGVCGIFNCTPKHYHVVLKPQLEVVEISTRLRGITPRSVRALIRKKMRAGQGYI